MIPPNISTQLYNKLSAYMYANIWNSPDSELRHNYVLRAVSTTPAWFNETGEVIKPPAVIPVSSVVQMDVGTLSLPTVADGAESYQKLFYVYAVPLCCLHGLRGFPKTWTKLSTFLNSVSFDLRIHGSDGEWLWRAGIYVRTYEADNSLVFAISREMAQFILNQRGPYNFMRMCMSVYVDSDTAMTGQTSPVVGRSCYQPVSLAERNLIYAVATTTPSKKLVFVNGREAQLASATDIQNYDYVEIIHDPDIICKLTLNLSTVGQNNTYHSTVHTVSKHIIHIPKAYNSNNIIITHNTCDVFIRPNNAGIRGDGLFVHRFNSTDKIIIFGHGTPSVNGVYDIVTLGSVATRRMWTKLNHKVYYKRLSGIGRWVIEDTTTNTVLAALPTNELSPFVTGWSDGVDLRNYADDMFTQLTHNDFAISDILVHAYKTALNTDEVSIHVVVRKHKKTKPLVLDNSYIRYLYRLEDAEIIQFLTGRGNTNLPFWKASHLEVSGLTATMFDVPDTIDHNQLTDQVNTLGYYNTINALGVRMSKWAISDKLIVTDHAVSNVNGTYEMAEINELVWSNGTYTLSYDMVAAKWRIKKDGTVYAEQIVGQENPVWCNWTSSVGGTEIDVFVTEHASRSYTQRDVALFGSGAITAHVYCNGIKLPTDKYSTVQLSSGGFMCTLSNDVVLPYGKHVVVEPFNNDMFYGEVLTPASGALTTSAPSTSKLYLFTATPTITADKYTERTEVTEYLALPTVGAIRLLNEEELLNYVDLTGSTITFKSAAIGLSFYAHSNDYYRSITQTISLSDLESGMIQSGPLMIPCATFSDPDITHMVPIPPDANCLVYLNGKELVEGIDYKLSAITAASGHVAKVVFINNCEYLTSDENTLEYVVTSTVAFPTVYGFVLDSKIDNIRAAAQHQPNLSVVVADGCIQSNAVNISGRVHLIDNVRNGALFKIRTLVPAYIKEFVDSYARDPLYTRMTETEDIARISAVVEFFRSRLVTNESAVVIEHSHHIYSITINEIIKDALAGTLSLVYEPGQVAMLAQVSEYLKLMTYDAALSGGLGTVVVSTATQSAANGIYTKNSVTTTGSYRVWTNSATRQKISYNAVLGRWEIRSSVVGNPTIYYTSESDSTGALDPWHLTWSAYLTGDTSIPLVRSGNLNLKYIDLLPSYRKNEAYSRDLYINLRQIIRFLFPVDATLDGATILLDEQS